MLLSFLIINKARFLSKFFAFKLTEKSVPFPLSRCSYLHFREGNVEDKKFRVQRLIALSVTGTQDQECIPRTWDINNVCLVTSAMQETSLPTL